MAPPGPTLVTGATGYIGVNTCRHLAAAGWPVHALVREGSDVSRLSALPRVPIERMARNAADLPAIFARLRPACVVNLAAAMPGATAADMAAGNQEFAATLVRALEAVPRAWLVHAATWSEWDSKGQLNPPNDYARAKYAAREILEAAATKDTDFGMVSLVIHDTYGPGDWRGKVLSHMLEAVYEGTELAMTDGHQRMDLVHIDDVAGAIRQAAERGNQPAADVPERFAVASGVHVSVRDIAAALEQAAGEPVPARWGALDYRPDTPMAPGQIAPTLPGWSPRVSLKDGMRQIWQAYVRDRTGAGP